MLLSDADEYPIFILKVWELGPHFAKIEVIEVTGWSGDDQKEPIELAPYFEATIQWEGSSHIYFGTPEDGRRDGCLYMGGLECWKRHCRVMEWAYKETTKLIKEMMTDELWVENE